MAVVECSGRNVEVTAALRKLAEERTQRLERHLGGPADVRVVLSHEKHRFGAEIIATHRRQRWEATEETADARAALAAAFEKIDAQAVRDAEKRRGRKHRGWSRLDSVEAPSNGGGERKTRGNGGGRRAPRMAARVVRSRPAAAKPMGVDEAALAMESSGENVLVFRDSANDRVSVLYRRRDGDLGLIVPEC
ncbi:MAG TPA: ribosome-associated translation inhibitor RaiA [Thermoanaerobaculia bacterium]|jgi:putative sigma-54 modulation protein|nr:ribosome-associated translation inhibitor RaiA [Thermoanaerobaculia bacterium]